MRPHFFIRARKSRRKIRPANEVSESEINALFQAIKDFDGYPRIRDLGRMAPGLTPLQINVIIRYLEKSGAILLDSESHIIWKRKDQERLTLGEVGIAASWSEPGGRWPGSSNLA